MMTEKILVPVDGSVNSGKGLKYACWLANRVGAQITVVHVVDVPYTGESAVLHVDSLIAAGKKILKDAKKIVEAEGCTSVVFELRQGKGNSGHEIITFCKEGGFSMIVMSATGHTALSHLLLGSVSDMVVHYAPCPVVIVR
jgi:nucleotide-binding universal stress UspA family protein